MVIIIVLACFVQHLLGGSGTKNWGSRDCPILLVVIDDLSFVGPNTLTFQLMTGDKQLYVVGTCIPPNCTRGVEDIGQAAEVCPVGCKLLVKENLKVNVGIPCDKREDVIINLLDKLCLVDSSCRYRLWTPRRTATRARWTWIQKRGTTQPYL